MTTATQTRTDAPDLPPLPEGVEGIQVRTGRRWFHQMGIQPQVWQEKAAALLSSYTAQRPDLPVSLTYYDGDLPPHITLQMGETYRGIQRALNAIAIREPFTPEPVWSAGDE